jgi:small subunit ribosomal protein S6e
MVLKLNISDKGLSWKIEIEPETFLGKSIGDKVEGKELNSELEGYEFEITGGSDSSGFPMSKDVEGEGLKKVLLSWGWGMHKRPKGNKKRVSQPQGLRLRKTIRGKKISEASVQINLKVVKSGKKKLSEVFPEQNKQPEPEAKAEAPAQ